MVKRVTNHLSNRRQARALAVQAIYLLTTQKNPQLTVDEALNFALEAGDFPEPGYDTIRPDLEDFIKELVQGVVDNRTAIDEKLSSYLTDWTVDSIAKIDASILRLALFELFFVDEDPAPGRVVVNEAIELAKGFSNDTSREFINGLLNRALREKESESSDE